MNGPRDEFTARALRPALDTLGAQLPSADLERLAASRRMALSRRRAARSSPWTALLPPLTLASAALLLVVLQINIHRAKSAGEEGAGDSELIGTNTDLELLEDLEFYEWLDHDGTTG